jgi:hypothetical protein
VRWQAEDPPVDKWWADVPDDVNKALRCDGLVVIDCDTPEAIEFFESLGFVSPGADVSVKTPRGRHYYFTLPEGVDPPEAGPLKSPLGEPRHIDVKTGPGHYVLVPPSVNRDGAEYVWRTGTSADDAPQAPQGLLDWLNAHRAPRASETNAGPANSTIRKSHRNVVLTSFAGLMRRHGLNDQAVGRVLDGLNRQLTEEPLPESEVRSIVASSARWEPDEQTIELVIEREGAELISWCDNMVLPPPPRWLWHPYIPEGRLVLLDGAEGIGKGMFCTYVATQVTTGAWDVSGNVLWMSAEDDPAEDILKRLHAAGWKPGRHRVGFFNVWPEFPRHIEFLKKLIYEHDAKLVIMDPGRSFVRPENGMEMSYNNEAAIRPALQQLNRLAQETGTTILFVHHWNKDSGGSVRTRAGGSASFSQVVRHRIAMAKEGVGDGAEWAFEVNKSNLIEAGHLREYRLVRHETLHTARLVVGELIIEHDDLDSWIKERQRRRNARTTIDLDPAEKIGAWAAANLKSGDRIPSRDQLANLAGVSRDDISGALIELQGEGRVTQVGRSTRRVWNG